MKVYRGTFIAPVYGQILKDLLKTPEYIANPRGMEVREIINCIMEIEQPNINLYENSVRSSQKKYIGAEILWYFSGTNKIDFISNYASMWSKLTNEDGTVNSAYGNLVFKKKNEHGFTQYGWVIESLKRDKDSRQAFMHFNVPEHQFLANKDQVCTLIALFHIRDNKLNMTLNMRSNDVILGFMTDFTFFNLIHQQVYLHMKAHYPEISMGSYTHTSHSMHLYARHYELVENMLKEEFKPSALPGMNQSIIDEQGNVLEKYQDIFDAVLNNTEIPNDITDNNLLNWAIPLIELKHD
jgi:thymidylate synthase